MDLTFVPWLFLFVVALLLGGMLLRTALFARAMRRAARELGLEWSQGGALTPGELSGSFEGENVDVFVQSTVYGTTQWTTVIVQVDLQPPLDATFHVAEERLLDRLAHVVGMHDVEVGDPAFDRLYRIKGHDPERLARIFDPTTRLALIAMAKGSAEVHVTPTHIKWEHPGRLYAARTIARAVRRGVIAAKAMRRAAAA